MKPETISTKQVYKGRIFDVRVDTIREGEVEYTREVVSHNGSAVIVPLFADGTVALVRQYRHPAGKSLLEVPAGSVEKGENPLTGAIRELEEEIGVTAGKMEKLASFYISPGFLSEKMNLFLATDLTETTQRLEDDEIIEIERIPLTEALTMTRDGRIEDAKTIIGLMLCQNRLP